MSDAIGCMQSLSDNTINIPALFSNHISMPISLYNAIHRDTLFDLIPEETYGIARLEFLPSTMAFYEKYNLKLGLWVSQYSDRISVTDNPCGAYIVGCNADNTISITKNTFGPIMSFTRTNTYATIVYLKFFSTRFDAQPSAVNVTSSGTNTYLMLDIGLTSASIKSGTVSANIHFWW